MILSDSREEARAAIEALGPGDALVLAGEDPREIVDELEEEQPGRLDWSLLEDSPEHSRLEVRRRASSGPRTVTGFLQGDHQRLDAIVIVVERLTEAEARQAAPVRDALGELTAILGAHNMKEERMLYPMTDRAIDTVEAQERLVLRIAKF